eukprot:UN03264
MRLFSFYSIFKTLKIKCHIDLIIICFVFSFVTILMYNFIIPMIFLHHGIILYDFLVWDYFLQYN